MSLRKSLRLMLLSLRDLLVSVGPLVFIVAGVLVAAYWFLKPQPPKTVTLATGPSGSAYANFGQRYQKALAADGITVELIATRGSLDNLVLLRDGGADLAFVRGGTADPVADEEAGIESLGSLFYEPLWVFYRSEVGRRLQPKSGELDSIAQLKGLRLNVDDAGSGVPDIVQKLLRVNHTDAEADRITLSNLAPEPATEALQAGLIDAMVLASAPQSALVQRLLRAPDIRLMEFPQNDAYARRFAFLSPVTLPRGIVVLDRDLPPADVPMLATTTALLSRGETHPALKQVFAQTAQKLHGAAGWFAHARDFPNTRTSELPVSAEGDRAINGNPPVWQRFLPFWASNLIERMWLVLGGVLVLMLPLSRLIPPLYTFRVRRRVFRWYARLREVEHKIEAGGSPRDKLLEELDALDRTVNHVAVPLSYADELYALRANIHGVRKRVLAQGTAARPQAPKTDATH